ncbi:T9SS C-terminal target domain-containing protein, partial [bacterium]
SGGAIYLKAKSVNDLIIKKNRGNFNFATKGSGGFLLAQATGLMQNVTLEENSLNSAEAEVTGGYVFLKSSSVTNINIANNICKSSSTALAGNGGFIFAETDFPTEGKLDVSGNIVDRASAGISGGCYYIYGSLPNQINIKNNTVSVTSTSKKNGGMFFIGDKRPASKTNIEFTNNSCGNKTHAKESGGMLYLSSKGFGAVNLVKNEVKKASANVDGGLFQISSPGVLDALSLSENKISELVDSTGYGGLISLNVNQCNALTISKSYIKQAKTIKDGGLFFISASLPGGFEFKNNSFGNVYTGGRGGIIFIDASIDSSITIEGNDFGQSNADLSGGAIYVNNRSKGPLPSFAFTGNNIQTAKSGDDGGIVCYSGREINSLNILSNVISGSIESVGNGGGFAIDYEGAVDGSIGNSIIIQNNNFGQSIADLSGGVFYIKNRNKNALITLAFNDNTLKTATSGNHGGIGYYSGLSIGSLTILGNVISDSLKAAGNGGGFAIDCEGSVDEVNLDDNEVASIKSGGQGGVLSLMSSSLNSFNCLRNVVKGAEGVVSAQNGGVISLDRIVNLSTVTISDNKISNIECSNNGGVFFVKDSVILDKFNLTANTFNGIKAGNNGGVVYLAPKSIKSLEVQKNKSRECRAEVNGGVLYLSGNLLNISLTKESIVNCKAVNSGGYIYLSGRTNSNNALHIKELTASNNNFDKTVTRSGQVGFLTNLDSIHVLQAQCSLSKATEKGGAFCIQNSGEVEFHACLFSQCQNDETYVDVYPDGGGSAIYSENNKILKINLCSFIGNSGTRGTVNCHSPERDRFVLVTNCHFNGNQAFAQGGGLAVTGGYLRLNTCTFSANNAVNWGYGYPTQGGAVYLMNVQSEIFGCKIFQNTADFGGAVYAESKQENNELNLAGSYFVSNTATQQGGGIFCINMGGYAKQCHIGYNQLIKDKADAGAGVYMFNDNQTYTFENCLVYNNTCEGNPKVAGIYFKNSSYSSQATLLLYNCTLWNHDQYAIYPDDSYSTPFIRIKNSIIYGFGTDEGKAQSEIFNPVNDSICYSDIQNLPLKKFSCQNIDQYPLFADLDFLKLEKDSPCKDMGDPDTIEYDHYMPPGIGSKRNDIGATGGPRNLKYPYYKIGPMEDDITSVELVSLDDKGRSEFRILNFINTTSYQFSIEDSLFQVSQPEFSYQFPQPGRKQIMLLSKDEKGVLSAFGLNINVPALSLSSDYTPFKSQGPANDQEIPHNLEISIFPNPFNADVYLKLPMEFSSPTKVTLISSTGEVLMIKEFSEVPEKIIKLELSEFKSGLYFINLIGPTFNQTHKIVKLY